MIDNQDIRNAIIEKLKQLLAVNRIGLKVSEYDHGNYYKLDNSFTFKLDCDNGVVTVYDTEEWTPSFVGKFVPARLSVHVCDPDMFKVIVDHLKDRYCAYLVGPEKAKSGEVRKSLGLDVV